MDFGEKLMHRAKNFYKAQVDQRKPSRDQVDSRDNDLHFWYQQMSLSKSDEERTDNEKKMQDELSSRGKYDSLFVQFDTSANAPEIPQDYDCLRMMVGGVEEMCGKWSSYGLKYVRKLANMCDTYTSDEIADAYAKIGESCGAF